MTYTLHLRIANENNTNPNALVQNYGYDVSEKKTRVIYIFWAVGKAMWTVSQRRTVVRSGLVVVFRLFRVFFAIRNVVGENAEKLVVHIYNSFSHNYSFERHIETNCDTIYGQSLVGLYTSNKIFVAALSNSII